MEDNAFYIIFIAAVFGIEWTVYRKKFARYLSENHEKIYHSLGDPPLRQKRFYSLDDIQGGFSEIRYLLSGSYKKTNDSQLIKIGNRLRFLSIIQLALMIFIVIYIIIPAYLSPSKCDIKKIPSPSVNKAYTLYQKGSVNEAIEILNKTIISNSEESEPYYYRGIMFEQINENNAALTDFEKSVERNPNHYESYRHIDWLYTQQQEFDKIIHYWNVFISHNPDHAQAHLERGGAYYHLNNLEKAMEDAHKACDLGNSEGCDRYKQLKGR